MRIDKWIWAVRMIKTRSQATEHCKLGHVLLNGNTVKPAKIIKIGDTIDVHLPHIHKRYRVQGFIQKQASAERVAGFFEDITPATSIVQEQSKLSGQVRKAHKKEYEKRKYRKDQGKLTKRERRKYTAFFDA